MAHDLNGKLRLGAGMLKIMGAFLPPCASQTVSGVGVPNPLSVIMHSWFILKTLPDPPPDGPSWGLLPVSVRAISQLALGVAAVTVRQLAASGRKMTDREILSAIREANAHAMHQLFSEQVKAYRRAADNAEKWVKQMTRH